MRLIETREESALALNAKAREFAYEAALGLAEFTSEDLAAGNLTLVFALSAWLRTSRIGVVHACSSLLALRVALLEVSGLEKASEPIPLLAGDPKSSLTTLAFCVHGLVHRAVAHTERTAEVLVEEAIELLP